MANDLIELPRQKMIFIATNNPRGDEPLWPKPHGCAGYGLWKLIREAVGWEQDEYLMRTERIDIIKSQSWNLQQAKENIELMRQQIDGRRAILIGKVAATLLDVPEWCEWHDKIAAIPNPSHINPFYADKGNLAVVVDFLREALL